MPRPYLSWGVEGAPSEIQLGALSLWVWSTLPQVLNLLAKHVHELERVKSNCFAKLDGLNEVEASLAVFTFGNVRLWFSQRSFTP